MSVGGGVGGRVLSWECWVDVGVSFRQNKVVRNGQFSAPTGLKS